MPEPHMRAADSDRAAVAAVLGRAMADGRLTLVEYEDRVGRAYAARTYGELAELTTDLPSAGTPRDRGVPAATQQSLPRPVPSGACGPAWGHGYGRVVWTSWLTTALIVTSIWLMTAIGAGHAIFFWPFWVLGPWGFVLLSRTFGRPAGRNYPHRRLPR